MAARVGHVGKPGDAKLAHILVVDLGQRAVPRLTIALSGKRPVVAVAAGFQKFAVNLGKGGVFRAWIVIDQLAAGGCQ